MHVTLNIKGLILAEVMATAPDDSPEVPVTIPPQEEQEDLMRKSIPKLVSRLAEIEVHKRMVWTCAPCISEC